MYIRVSLKELTYLVTAFNHSVRLNLGFSFLRAKEGDFFANKLHGEQMRI